MQAFPSTEFIAFLERHVDHARVRDQLHTVNNILNIPGLSMPIFLDFQKDELDDRSPHILLWFLSALVQQETLVRAFPKKPFADAVPLLFTVIGNLRAIARELAGSDYRPPAAKADPHAIEKLKPQYLYVHNSANGEHANATMSDIQDRTRALMEIGLHGRTKRVIPASQNPDGITRTSYTWDMPQWMMERVMQQLANEAGGSLRHVLTASPLPEPERERKEKGVITIPPWAVHLSEKGLAALLKILSGSGHDVAKDIATVLRNERIPFSGERAGSPADLAEHIIRERRSIRLGLQKERLQRRQRSFAQPTGPVMPKEEILQ